MNPGKYPNLSNEAYHSALGLSSSVLRQLARSRAHYDRARAGLRKPTPSMVLGTRVHCSVLEPERFDSLHVIAPDCRRGTKEWDKFVSDYTESIQSTEWEALKPDEHQEICAIRDSVWANPDARILLGLDEECKHKIEVECSYFWNDPLTKELCKCRPDIYIPGASIAVDLKTSSDGGAESGKFNRTVFDYKYHVQAAMYMDGLKANMEPVDSFWFIVVETAEPYVCSVFELGKDWINKGYEEYYALLEKAHNLPEYSGYAPGYELLCPEEWMLRR